MSPPTASQWPRRTRFAFNVQTWHAKQHRILHNYLVRRRSSSILKLSFTATALSPLPSPLKKATEIKKVKLSPLSHAISHGDIELI